MEESKRYTGCTKEDLERGYKKVEPEPEMSKSRYIPENINEDVGGFLRRGNVMDRI